MAINFGINFDINHWVSPNKNRLKVEAGWWFQPTPLKHMSSSVGMIVPNMDMEKYSDLMGSYSDLMGF